MPVRCRRKSCRIKCRVKCNFPTKSGTKCCLCIGPKGDTTRNACWRHKDKLEQCTGLPPPPPRVQPAPPRVQPAPPRVQPVPPRVPPAPPRPPPRAQPAPRLMAVENCHANSLYQRGPTCALATIVQLTLRTPLIVFFEDDAQRSPAGPFLRETERMFMQHNTTYCPKIPDELLTARNGVYNGGLTKKNLTDNKGFSGLYLIAHFLKLSKVRCRFIQRSPAAQYNQREIDITNKFGFNTLCPGLQDFMLFSYTDTSSYSTELDNVARADFIDKTLFSQIKSDAEGLAKGMLYIGSELRLQRRDGTGDHGRHSVAVFPCNKGKDHFIMCNHWGDKVNPLGYKRDCQTLRAQLQAPLTKDYELVAHNDYWVSRKVYERWLNTVKRSVVDLSEDAPARSKKTLKYAKHE